MADGDADFGVRVVEAGVVEAVVGGHVEDVTEGGEVFGCEGEFAVCGDFLLDVGDALADVEEAAEPLVGHEG